MSIIDTHTHIYDESFDTDIESVIERAKESNLEYILLPNVDIESIDILHILADRYNGYCLPMMGLHPTSVTPNWQADLDLIKEQLVSGRKYVAIGEIGIDLYWDTSLKEEQISAFEEQLKWSIEYNLPVSIHCRNAIREAIDAIKKIGSDRLKGVFHSFGGTKEELLDILALQNFYLGINGTVTYKKSTLPEVISNTDLSHIIIETDAPYLPPVPYRGKRNEPSYTKHIVDKLGTIYNVDKGTVEQMTTANAKKLFNLD